MTLPGITRINRITVSGGSLIALGAMFVLLSLLIQPAFSQQSTSLVQELQRLEEQLGLPVDPAKTMSERLAAIESRMLGHQQTGSIISRLAELNRLAQLQANAAAVTPGQIASTGYLQDSFELLNAGAPNFLRNDPPEGSVSPDYLSDVMKGSKGRIMRFKAMPVPVYVTPYSDRLFVEAVVHGFEDWEQRSDGVVRFIQVAEPDKARIRVIWKHLGAKQDASGCLLGAHTITKFTSNGRGSLSFVGVGAVPVPVFIPRVGPKYTVPAQVIEVNLDLIMTKNSLIRYRVLQNIVTHELGHALGLLGHSNNIADMMNPLTDEHSRLSQRDVNTLLKLYRLKVEVPL